MEDVNEYIDETWHFTGKWEMPSLCGLAIRKFNEVDCVLLTELYQENPGSSVTEMITTVAPEIAAKYNLDPGKTEFIVRNPERSAHYSFFAETFHRAVMAWNGEIFVLIRWEKIKGFNPYVI